MIQVAEFMIKPEHPNLELMSGQAKKILENMALHNEVYRYPSFKELFFEIKMRLNIKNAAKDLNISGAKFATFATSTCNPVFWELRRTGAFVLKKDILPSDAIIDIFKNGQLYAFECATAMVIVFYKATLDSITTHDFNRLFADLVLYDWHYDKDLGLSTTRGNEFLVGDCIYFKNPEFNPNTPYWRGENAIVMDHDLYYGHGIGITSAEKIIEHLNKMRREHATESAYILEQVTRPDFHSLSTYEHPLENRFPALDLSLFSILKVGDNTIIKV